MILFTTYIWKHMMVTKITTEHKVVQHGFIYWGLNKPVLEVGGGGVVAGGAGLGCTKYTCVVIVIYKWLLQCWQSTSVLEVQP